MFFFFFLSGQISYSEVDHWMWRLFLDDYGEVCGSLGLSHCLPFSATLPLPAPTPLLYGISPTLAPRQSYWPARYCSNCSMHMSGRYITGCVCPFLACDHQVLICGVESSLLFARWAPHSECLALSGWYDHQPHSWGIWVTHFINVVSQSQIIHTIIRSTLAI